MKEYGYECLVEISTVQLFSAEEKATMPVVVFAPIKEGTSKEKEPDQADNSETLKEGGEK